MNGERGEDLIIPVPLGTIVKDEATGHVIADMDKVGQQVKVVSGGRGGSPMTTAGGGEKGQRRMIILEYKMYNDVGLVGYVGIRVQSNVFYLRTSLTYRKTVFMSGYKFYMLYVLKK